MKSTLLDCPLGLFWQEAALCRLLVTADLSIGSNGPEAEIENPRWQPTAPSKY